MSKNKITTIAQRHQVIRAKLEGSQPEIVKALGGSSMNVGKFTRVALTAWERGDENLMKAHPMSIFSAVLSAAQLGLSLDPLIGEAYLVARNNKKHGCMWASLMIGYQGLLKRARNSKVIEMFDAGVIYEGDHVTIRQGTDPSLEHRRNLDVGITEEPAVVAAWAVAHFKGGYQRIVVCPKWEIDKARKLGAKYGPWVDHYAAMAQKTALRRLIAVCPMDDDTKSALSQEDADERGDFVDTTAFEPMSERVEVVETMPVAAAGAKSIEEIRSDISGKNGKKAQG